jgi:hypothetical protein
LFWQEIFTKPLELVEFCREAMFMCELLGLCFNKEVSFELAFSGLKAGAIDNPNGWEWPGMMNMVPKF